MIALSVCQNPNQYIIFGNEPFRVSVVKDAPTCVYCGTSAEKDAPDWQPTVLFDPDNDENYSQVSFSEQELNAIMELTTEKLAETLQLSGFAKVPAQFVAQAIKDGTSWYDVDSERWIVSVNIPFN